MKNKTLWTIIIWLIIMAISELPLQWDGVLTVIGAVPISIIVFIDLYVILSILALALAKCVIRAIEKLEKHPCIDMANNTLKSRLLTDEDVDKWEEYKQLEEQGRLVKLPCKVGDAYVFTAKKSFLNPDTNQYDTIQRKMTSEEVEKHFELSAACYRESHSKDTERTLVDEMDDYHQNYDSKTETPMKLCAYEYEHNDGDQIWCDTTTFYQVNDTIKKVYTEGYNGKENESFVTKNEMVQEMEDVKTKVGLYQRGGFSILKDLENVQENTMPLGHSHRR